MLLLDCHQVTFQEHFLHLHCVESVQVGVLFLIFMLPLVGTEFLIYTLPSQLLQESSVHLVLRWSQRVHNQHTSLASQVMDFPSLQLYPFSVGKVKTCPLCGHGLVMVSPCSSMPR